MTPTAPELLMGCVTALSTPPAEEDGGVYVAGKIGLAAIINVFCAQECAGGAAARVWENAALRSLVSDASASYDARLDGALASAVDIGDGDVSLQALDAANAELRRRLIQLHEAVEAASDAMLDRRILTLYRQMADRRLLHLPS
jgi:hypothetical protein